MSPERAVHTTASNAQHHAQVNRHPFGSSCRAVAAHRIQSAELLDVPVGEGAEHSIFIGFVTSAAESSTLVSSIFARIILAGASTITATSWGRSSAVFEVVERQLNLVPNGPGPIAEVFFVFRLRMFANRRSERKEKQ